ncbi:MAG: aminopeptidase P N-terminal domain-containing protein [Candidatus Babeliales bacterium]
MEHIHNYTHYVKRRSALKQLVKEHHQVDRGLVMLIGGFEGACDIFRQDASFYYATGLKEPSLIALIDLEGQDSLYIPHNSEKRLIWTQSILDYVQEDPSSVGFDDVCFLGEASDAYTLSPWSSLSEYAHLLTTLEEFLKRGLPLFTLLPSSPMAYIEQKLLFDRMMRSLQRKDTDYKDISCCMATLRRNKSREEVEDIYKAVEITCAAHEAAAKTIHPGVWEYQVQASLEYIFTVSASQKAFPSIVASGSNSTILHYNSNERCMENDDVVVVDIGASYQGYCADITRTYPVSGVFNDRQKEIYDLVHSLQQYVASCAKPGVWLVNKDNPEQSLHHLAIAYLKDHGYEDRMNHRIGHFLGLEVHDVGDYAEPLKMGDVITIEPGLYLEEESLGVRIEDDFWIVEDGSVCLSEALPRTHEAMETMVQDQW